MIGTCSKCGKLYDFQSEEDAYEPGRLCLPCYREREAQRAVAAAKQEQPLLTSGATGKTTSVAVLGT